ncbi:MAG: TetR family transcriptional regulator [Alphaproteobacteria bacterium]|nr:TetR family transcriptional regulator [Alphaproteobacteria bacterium]
MPRPKQTDARTRLLDAAEALLASGDTPTLDAVCQRAGVSRATLYRRFGDKDGLLSALEAERGADVSLPGDVRQRALDAARRVFTTEGLGATMERVAEEAGLGPATLYRHFGDKAGLVQAFADTIGPGRELEGVELHGGKDLREDLLQLTAILLRFATRNRDLLRLGISLESDVLRSPARLRSGSTRARVGRFIASQVDAGRLHGDPFLLTRSLVGLIMSHATFLPLLDGIEPDPDAARHITDLFLTGAQAP